MNAEVYKLVKPLDGYQVGDVFLYSGSTDSHVQLNPERRPTSILAVHKDMFADRFEKVTA